MFRLEPAYKDYIWGGTRLQSVFHKNAPFARVAESWELSVHPDGLTRIGGAADPGMTLRDYLAAHPEATPGISLETFPILVKLIDAKTPLSVQVHPDDAYARAHADSPGKTELWHILATESGAYLYLGVRRAVTREELSARIKDGTVETVLRRVEVHPGETYYIPAGTLHAIGSGVLLAEVQESSNLTYRVFDYGRRDALGNTRPLHIEQALAVATLNPTDCTPPGSGACIAAPGESTLQTLVNCPYFTMQRIALISEEAVPLEKQAFTHLLCVEGVMDVRQDGICISLAKGEGLFVPGNEAVTIAGRAAALCTTAGTRG